MPFAKLRNNILLAPMAGVTDAAFRHLAIACGAGLTYTEMVSAKGLLYSSKKTASLLSPADNEDIFGVQLFTSDTDALRHSIDMIQDAYTDRISLFDINMGCPAPKITGNGEGCALMKNIPLAERIISSAVNTSRVPITIKFRKGWDDDSVNAVDFAKMAENAGAAAVTIHGRTRQQFYTGRSDRRIIADVKHAVGIPVIGNGDIFDAKDAVNMFDETGCDAIMVARGAMGHPFIFREILHYLQTGQQLPAPTPEQRAAMLLRQARLSVVEKGEHLAIRQIRKHAAWYLKGIKNAAQIRSEAVKIMTLKDLEQLLLRVFPDIGINEIVSADLTLNNK